MCKNMLGGGCGLTPYPCIAPSIVSRQYQLSLPPPPTRPSQCEDGAAAVAAAGPRPARHQGHAQAPPPSQQAEKGKHFRDSGRWAHGGLGHFLTPPPPPTDFHSDSVPTPLPSLALRLCFGLNLSEGFLQCEALFNTIL